MNKVLVTLTGPTCSGKSTLENRLISLGFSNIISTTTRPIRRGEVNGENYYFKSEEEFLRMVEAGKMVESVKFGDYYYGAAAAEFERCFAENKPIVIVVEPEGRKQIEQYAAKNGWSLIKVFIDIKRHKQLERFLARFSDELQKAPGTDAKAALQSNYANRLYQAMVNEQAWISEAYRWNRPYDLLIDRYDEQTAAEVEVMISELAAISKLEQLSKEAA